MEPMDSLKVLHPGGSPFSCTHSVRCATFFFVVILDFFRSLSVRGSLLSLCRKEEEEEICEGHIISEAGAKILGFSDSRGDSSDVNSQEDHHKAKSKQSRCWRTGISPRHEHHPEERPSELTLTFLPNSDRLGFLVSTFLGDRQPLLVFFLARI